SARVLTAAAILAVLICGATYLPAPTCPNGGCMQFQGKLNLLNPQPLPPSDGPVDMQFQLFDSPTNGLALSGVITQRVDVTSGLFTAPLEFAPSNFFGAGPFYLDIGVKPTTYVYYASAPRLPVTPTPVAWHALFADSLAP